MLKRFTDSPKIQYSLDISWKEGIAAAVMLGIMDYYVIPYGLFLGASSQQIGFLVAIPHLLASIFQLFAVRLLRFAGGGSRLRFLILGTWLQAVSLFPLALLALFPASTPQKIIFLVLIMIAFKVLSHMINTAWGSLMSDYLPAHTRGRYMGWRSQVVGTANVVSMALAGMILFLSKSHIQAFGFFIIFLLAFISRIISCVLMGRMADLPLQRNPESDFTFFMFIRRIRESNFVKFVLYASSITFATYLASPYMSVYLLRDLKWDYLNYTLIHLSAVIAGLISFPLWGKHADMVGNAQILKINSFFIPFIPLLWMLSSNFFFLFLVQALSGFIWAGFNLCTVNFIYDAVTPDKRVRCLGYYNLIHGVALCFGSALGGFLAEKLPPVGGHRLLTLFFISFVLRAAAHFVLSGKFREVRESTHKVPSLRLFSSVVGIDPLEDQAASQ